MLGVTGGFLQSLKIASLRKEFRNGVPEMELLDGLRNVPDRDSTDARDKVIGVLGLCRADPELTSGLGYHLSLRDTYLAVARHILSSSDPFRLFNARAPALDNRQEEDSFPTWAPDWSQRVALMPCTQDFERGTIYQAGGPEPQSARISQSTDGPDSLSIRGKIISSLTTFVDKNSDALRQAFEHAHYPDQPTWLKWYLPIGSLYIYSTFCCLVDCYDSCKSSRPKRTIEQFFLATCWSVSPAKCDIQTFWKTMACALTNARTRNEAMLFENQLMKYAERDHQHNESDTVQASFLYNLEAWTQVRKFCVTSTGQIGWVPREAQIDDVICVFDGARLPYVLRRAPAGDAYTIVGHCFIHGIMFGEAMEDDQTRSESIVLK
ncbi:hypothetical protein MMC25_004928 [Agyrium rufum]|nr:hypothetical protein [Agyrium rufum]